MPRLAFWRSPPPHVQKPPPEPVVESVPQFHTTVLHTQVEIAHFCASLVRAKTPLQIHDSAGAHETLVCMVRSNDTEVVLEWPMRTPARLSGTDDVLQLVTAAPGGMSVFTLTNIRWTGTYVARAPLPALVIRNQSREHYRVQVPQRSQLSLALHVQGWDSAAQVIDVSESGLCFESQRRMAFHLQRESQSKLILADVEVRVPQLRVVRETNHASGQWRYGAAISQLQEDDIRALRRWIQQTETHALLTKRN